MANHASAKKRIRQTTRRNTVNSSRLSRVRTFIRKVEQAIDKGDLESAKTALGIVQPIIMRGAQKGVLHRNTAARKLSRLSTRIKVLQS